MTQTEQAEKNKRLKSDIYFNTCYIVQKMSNKLYLENVYTLKKSKKYREHQFFAVTPNYIFLFKKVFNNIYTLHIFIGKRLDTYFYRTH